MTIYDLMFWPGQSFFLYTWSIFQFAGPWFRNIFHAFFFFLFHWQITDVDPRTDVIERVNEIYTAVVQSEECMEKIACEVGALAGDVGLTQSPALK